ncbi:MAG: hypothetical protein SFT93_01390 [Rickettsiaceae bacterium]|nr:hypothetical protein [Rickettsiaceae bacterium]
MRIFSPIKDNIFLQVKLIKHTALLFKNALSTIISSLHDLLYHFTILKAANISLGKFHLRKGNTNEAIRRFKIIDKIFFPNDPENLYFLSWAYIKKREYGNALKLLENNQYDQLGVADYISNISSYNSIPKDIREEYEMIFGGLDGCSKPQHIKNLLKKTASAILPFVPVKSFDATKATYKVLEISSNPDWLESIKKFFPSKTRFDTVNFLERIDEEVKILNKRKKFYTNIISSDNFPKSAIDEKYNAIISVCSLTTSANLDETMTKAKKLLDDNGFFALVLPGSNFVRLEPSMNQFSYSKEFIEQSLKAANLNIIYTNSIKLDKSEYFIIVSQ